MSGGRSSASGWTPAKEGAAAAINRSEHWSGMASGTEEEIAAAAQQAAHGGQCVVLARD